MKILQSIAASLAAAITGEPGIDSTTAPATRWIGLAHRGQAPARGILGAPVDPAKLGKGLSRRDKLRSIARLTAWRTRTRPDFSRQIAQEAKAARSAAARARAAGLR